MKTLIIIFAVLTAVMLLFTIICGLWMRAQPEVEASSINFHLGMALTTALCMAVTLILTVKQVA